MDVKVENFKDKTAVLTVIETIPGEWKMEETTHEYTKRDANTIEFNLTIPAKGEIKLSYHYHRLNVR